MVFLTRQAEFCASHFYHNPKFTAAENQRIFGKCNRPHGHGHNYTVQITIAGETDAATGMVLDLKELKDLIEEQIIAPMDHRHLNHEVAPFDRLIPTTENLAIEIWKRVAPRIHTGRLYGVRLYETPDLFVDFYGQFE